MGRWHEGVRAVSISLAVLGAAAVVQTVVFAVSGSVALLADLIHNYGDALTAVPLGIAFFLRSYRGEKLAGLAIVLAIFVSAGVALYETIHRFIHPQNLTHLWILAAAGVMAGTYCNNDHTRVGAAAPSSSERLVQRPALLGDPKFKVV